MKSGQLSRAEVRNLRAASLAGDAGAARSLLAHSVALKHDRLSLRRYAVARLLGAEGLEEFKPFCATVAAGMPGAKLQSLVGELTRTYRSELDVGSLIEELAPAMGFYQRSFAGVAPRLVGPPRFAASSSAILGRVTLGTGSVIGAGAVVRADGHFVRIGNDFVLGARSTVHIAHDVYPTVIGNKVAVGRNAIVHACTVGNRCIIEDDAVVLDGSVVGNDVILERGSVVFPRSTLEPGLVYAGSPAKAIRKVEPGEIAKVIQRLRKKTMADEDHEIPIGRNTENFIAQTAILEGDVVLASGASVFFGCRLDAKAGRISIGRNTNVQDNSLIVTTDGDVAIGEDTTIGHNVSIDSSQIGARSLIGMGSVLARGTRVEDDVLLAAGSTTEPGQVLESGLLWGGRPARAMKPLDEARRSMMRETISQYREYADQYQHATL